MVLLLLLTINIVLGTVLVWIVCRLYLDSLEQLADHVSLPVVRAMTATAILLCLAVSVGLVVLECVLASHKRKVIDNSERLIREAERLRASYRAGDEVPSEAEEE